MVVELKESSEVNWDIDLSRGEVHQGYNDFLRLSLADQIYLLRLTSVNKKYDVEKCMFMFNLRDYRKTCILFLFCFFLCLSFVVSSSD